MTFSPYISFFFFFNTSYYHLPRGGPNPCVLGLAISTNQSSINLRKCLTDLQAIWIEAFYHLVFLFPDHCSLCQVYKNKQKQDSCVASHNFLLSVTFLFYSNDGVLYCPDFFLCFMRSFSLIVDLNACGTGVLFIKSFPVTMFSSLFITFSSVKFRILSLTLRFLIHLELSFVKGEG